MAPPTTLPQYNTPAYLKDIKDPNGYKIWSDMISDWITRQINATQRGGGRLIRTPLKQFFNGTKTPYDQSADQAKITWTAFPKLVEDRFKNNTARWKATDNNRLDTQDEYCEFSVLRTGPGDADPIKLFVCTCEGPEYWDVLGKIQPEETLKLIKQMNAPLLDKATMDWFFTKDANNQWEYNSQNKFNNSSKGGTIISLAQINNSLNAEVDIAAQGTVVRKENGKIVTDADRLIKISGYGDPNRHSDPFIGAQINALCRQGFSVSIADPIAIYIHSFNTADLSLDTSGNRDGTNKQPIPTAWINLQRGKDLGKKIPMGLRLKISNETGQKTDDGSRLLDVSDIWDDKFQTNIRFGSQFLDMIKMGVSGVLGKKGNPPTIDDAEGPPERRPRPANLESGGAAAFSADGDEDEAPVPYGRGRTTEIFD